MTSCGCSSGYCTISSEICQPGWVDGTDKNLGCLYFHTESSMSPNDGEEFCQNKLDGSYLVEIYDSSQQAFIRQQLTDIGGSRHWFLGSDFDIPGVPVKL